MRLLLCAVAAVSAGGSAHAQPLSDSDALSAAAFADARATGPYDDPIAEVLNRDAPTGAARGLAGGDWLSREGLVQWRAREATRLAPDGAVERFRLSSAKPLTSASGGLALDRRSARLDDGEITDVSYVRAWPSAMRLEAGQVNVDVTPHGGFGVGSRGRSAEAGATVRVGGGDLGDRLDNLVQDGRKAYGNRGRWYLFAAASGRAVGYNMIRGEDGWRRSGVSTDEGSFIGDAQAGVAWRKGAMQGSFGYVHREIKAYDEEAHEGFVAFQLSFKPDW
jgi:hypothetical protein